MISETIQADNNLVQKIGKIEVSPRMQQDNDNPHMKCTPQLSLQSFSLFQQNEYQYTVTMESPSIQL